MIEIFTSRQKETASQVLILGRDGKRYKTKIIGHKNADIMQSEIHGGPWNALEVITTNVSKK